MSNSLTYLNTIRSNATETYKSRIPVATRDNIADIREALLDGDNVHCANEFIRSLLNQIGKRHIHAKMFNNPLAMLKKGNKPLGDGVQEVYNNFLKGQEYDPTGKKLMERNLPDTKAVYHRMNYQMQYPVTVTRDQLSKAFLSYDALDRFISNIFDTLYNSAELDEFLNMKQLLVDAWNVGAMKTIPVFDPLISKANGESFIKSVKTVSGLMKFPSEEFNGYTDVQDIDDKPITTFSRLDEQILILDTATDVSVSVDVLAAAFNMSVADFNNTRKIVIDVFPDPQIRAVLVDEAFFQLYDDLYTVTSFYNGQGLYENFYLNVWQTQAFSCLVNAVAFVAGNDNNSDGEVSSKAVSVTVNAEDITVDSPSVWIEGTSLDVTIHGYNGEGIMIFNGTDNVPITSLGGALSGDSDNYIASIEWPTDSGHPLASLNEIDITIG